MPRSLETNGTNLGIGISWLFPCVKSQCQFDEQVSFLVGILEVVEPAGLSICRRWLTKHLSVVNTYWRSFMPQLRIRNIFYTCKN